MRDMVQEATEELKNKHPSEEGWKYTAAEMKTISKEINEGLSGPSGLLLED